MKHDIVIIGGGIVGLMCAYNLLDSGREITIIEKGNLEDGTSFGNAGLLSAFGKNPLSAPGVLFDTAKLMLKGQSPVNIHPNLDLNLYKWLWFFMKSSSKERLRKTLPLFERYGKMSMDIYEKMKNDDKLNFHLCKDGLLMVYTEQESFNHKVRLCKNQDKYLILSKEHGKEYMPFLNDKVIGSILLKENGHLDPGVLMNELRTYLIGKNVNIRVNEEVQRLSFQGKKVTKIYTSKNNYEANIFVLSTGANVELSKQAQNNFIITPAKGYSITFEMDKELMPKTAALFGDLFIAMTPREKTVRITSKLELGSNSVQVNKKQIDSIHNNLSLYTNKFEMRNIVEWTGFRPLTPNDMPIIGYDERYSNLIHATGLGWLGVTLGPSVGKIISDLITKDEKNKDNIDILLFSSFYQG
jgi:D-amino-acid dehydrogenase